MVTASAQVAFAAQLVAMLVATSGLVLVLWRGELTAGTAGRTALATGFVILGATAFADGGDLGGSGATRGIAVARIAGAVVAFAGATRWTGGRRGGVALLTGAAAAAVAGGVGVAGAASPWAAVVLGVGALVTAVGLVGAGQRAIGVRVAANAAATLLLVVVVLAVALSSVLTASVEHQQLADQRSRASGQAADVVRQAATNLATARLVAGELEAYFAAPGRTGLAAVAAGAGAGDAKDRGLILTPLRTLSSFSPGVTIGVSVGRAALTTDAAAFAPAVAHGAGSLSCTKGKPGSTGTEAMAETKGAISALGSFTLCAGRPLREVGAVSAVTPIDGTYLAGIRSTATGAGVAVVGPEAGLLAWAGPRPDTADRAGALLSGTSSKVVDDRFVATVPIGISSPSWIVSTAPTAALVDTGHSLMRTLLLIALGGTVLTLVLAAATGSHITTGLRRITRVAEDVGEHGPGARSLAGLAGTSAPDEVGALAMAFDTMVEAVEDSSRALQHAADDETRLRNRLEAVVGGMGDALIALDGLGRVTDFNPAAEELIGIPASAAIGATGSELLVLSGDGAGRLQQHLDRGDATPWAGLADLRRPDGGLIPVAVSSGAVRGPFGEELGTVLVLRDLRREQEIERMKTQFLSRVGHELRTPLTGILGYAELLADRDVPPDVARPWHQEILAAARQQLRVVRLLEFFASWGAGRTALRPDRLDPAALVERVVGTWRPRVETGGATGVRRLDLTIEPGLPQLYADSAWLGLAVDEVIDNAVKYAPAGGVLAVSVKSGPVSPSSMAAQPGELIAEGAAAGPAAPPLAGAAAAVEITVSDQGVGMAPDEVARIFGAFEQGDASDTRRFGGLGLGLAAVVQIVGEHGGWVGCRSALGLGTTVRLVLPSAAPGGEEQGQAV